MRTLAGAGNNSELVLAGGDQAAIYRTDNGGDSWVLSNEGMPVGASVQVIAFDPTHPRTVYAGTDHVGIFRSADAGATWTAFVTESEFSGTYALLPVDGSTLLAGVTRGVFRIDPATGTWQTVASVFDTDVHVQLILYDRAAGVLYAGGTGGLFRIDWAP